MEKAAAGFFIVFGVIATFLVIALLATRVREVRHKKMVNVEKEYLRLYVLKMHDWCSEYPQVVRATNGILIEMNGEANVCMFDFREEIKKLPQTTSKQP